MVDDDVLDKKLEERKEKHAFGKLRLPGGATDLCSNDYLGVVTEGLIEARMEEDARRERGATAHEGGMACDDEPQGRSNHFRHGSMGSRLLAGNYPLIEETESFIAAWHEAESGLIFNSGYDANLGVLSCIPQRGDTILYDQLAHASIRDGIRLSFAHSFSFAHNDLRDLELRLRAAGTRGIDPSRLQAGAGMQAEAGMRAGAGNLCVVTESVFSMDGDQAPLPEIVALCGKYGARLIVDEAHAIGVVGAKGEGLV